MAVKETASTEPDKDTFPKVLLQRLQGCTESLELKFKFTNLKEKHNFVDFKQPPGPVTVEVVWVTDAFPNHSFMLTVFRVGPYSCPSLCRLRGLCEHAHICPGDLVLHC